MLMLLSKHPEIMQQMRDEHDAVFGKDPEDTKATLLQTPEKLQDLPKTEAIIKETLRLFPVGFPLREADRGSTLTYNGQAYPIDNAAIALQGHDLHYNPRFFPEPAKFNPERWLDPENEIPRSYFRTFSRGPRMCLGMNLAMNELKAVLLLVARDFDYRCAGLRPNEKPRALYTELDTTYGDIIFQEVGLEAKPRGGMMMTVKKRDCETHR